MNSLALLLVIAAAFIHATWNLYAKRVAGGAAFVWLFGALSSLLYAPLALGVVLLERPSLSLFSVLFIITSGGLHLLYFLLLQRGYRVGDLSLVYPLARGTGPLLSTLAAIAIFGERPTPLALAGAGLIVLSVFLLAGGGALFKSSIRGSEAIRFGLLTGVLIALYTLWDSYAVSTLLIHPLLFDWGANLSRVTLITPVALRQWRVVQHHWQEHRREVFIIAALSPLSYILVLSALTFSPVSYIAPAREVSILVGAVLGARLLKEGNVKRRLMAASLMVAGVVALALG